MKVNHSPAISIITVCRNSAATVAKTIESILAQKEVDVEYVIIDGASTDGTQDVIRSFPMVDRFVSEPDQGIADAFNKGIRLTTGEIVGLINSDDQLCPEAISFVRGQFADNPDVDVIHGDVLLFEGNRLIKRVKPSGRWWYPWRLVLFNHPATFVRRAVYQQHGLFDVSFRITMDVEIYFRWLSNNVNIRYVPEILVNMQAGGVSGQQAITGFREFCRSALKHGYNPLLGYSQFICKIFAWRVLGFFSWLTK